MKRRIIFAFFVCMAHFSGVVVSQTDSSRGIISPRIGQDIDETERNYFGLFPDIHGFVSATSFSGEQGGVGIAIHRAGAEEKSDTTIVLNRLLRESLRKYLEQYETMNQELGGSFELSDLPPLFGLLAIKGIIAIRHLSLHDPVTITLRRSDDKRFQGILCHADSSCVVMAHEDSLFSWNNPHAFLVTPVSAISELTHPQKGKFGRDFGKAFFVGFILGSSLVQSMGSSHNSGTDYPPAGAGLIGGALCGLATGLVGSALLRGSAAQTTVAINGSSAAYQKYLPLLRSQCLYQQSVPPELIRKVKTFQEARR